MILDLNICPILQKHLLPAAILDVISSVIQFLALGKVPKYLKFRTSSNICKSMIRSCCKFITFLLIFMCFVLFSLNTSPVLAAASLIRVTTSLDALTDRPTIITSSIYQRYTLFHSVKYCSIRSVSISLITFSSTIISSVVHSASHCLKLLPMPNASINCPRIFTFPFYVH